jgi:hypothetical protein
MAHASLTIVRSPAWQALLRRLDAAVAHDARLAEARDVVLRPVELLRVMAADAPGALADDVLRADRLRAMLFVAWPYAAVAFEARKLLAAKAPPPSPDTTMLAELVKSSGAGAPELGWPAMQPYDPGVIDHAGLAVLALAAARVADPPFAPVFVTAVQGVALAASAAEVLGRLDPRQPDVASLDVVLHTLYMIEAARTVTRNEFLRPFALDPVERGRWRCLAEIVGSPAIESAVRMGKAWDGATSDEILDVAPKHGGTGDSVTVRLRGSDPLASATVVFASADGPLRPTTATLDTTVNDVTSVTVVVPDGASPGWIGLSRPDMIAASNKARAALRGQLATLLEHACVDGTGRIVPEQCIPDYGALATPRRRGTNRFEGGVPVVLYAAVTPEAVRLGEQFELHWETAGATEVSIAVAGTVIDKAAGPAGTRVLLAPPNDGDVAITITPRATHGDHAQTGESFTTTLDVHVPVTIAALQITQQGHASPLVAGRPLDVVVQLELPAWAARARLLVDDVSLEPTETMPGRVTFTVPGTLVRDGMTLSATVEDRTGARDSRNAGPLVMRPMIRAEIVLVRPAIVSPGNGQEGIEGPLAAELAHEQVIAAAAAAGITANVVDLPWADDDLAALADRPEGDADPMLVRVFEALARRALITPRFEHAIWLALLPDSDRSGHGVNEKLSASMLAASTPLGSLARSLPASAARAVAVATPFGLARLFAGLYPADERPPRPIAVGQRLAIVGTVDEHGVTIEDVRLDERGEGFGAPAPTEFEAVTIDASGRELAHVPIRVLTTSRPASLAMLIPVSSTVASIEIRSEHGVHNVIRRIPRDLTLTIDTPASAESWAFEWSWKHTYNARPTATVVLRRNDLETPVLDLDPCHSHVDLPIWRYTGADEVAVYATDGWNAQRKPVGARFANDGPVVLRKLSDGRFFADVPEGATLTWLVDGEQRATNERTYRPTARDAGVLELLVRRADTTIREAVRLDR